MLMILAAAAVALDLAGGLMIWSASGGNSLPGTGTRVALIGGLLNLMVSGAGVWLSFRPKMGRWLPFFAVHVVLVVVLMLLAQTGVFS